MTKKGFNYDEFRNNLGEAELKILKLIAENKNIPIVDLRKKIEVSVSSIKRHFKRLIDSEILTREDSKKSET